MTYPTSSITYTDLIKKAKQVINFSYINKGQKVWLDKCYSDGQWLEAVKKAYTLQLYLQEKPETDLPQFIDYLIRKQITRKHSPLHIGIAFVLAGEPYSKLYYQKTGEPFYLNPDFIIKNFYTQSIINTSYHIDWTQWDCPLIINKSLGQELL